MKHYSDPADLSGKHDPAVRNIIPDADHKSKKEKYTFSSFLSSVRERLPGGYMLEALNPRNWDFHYGARVSLLRLLYHTGVFFIGGRAIKKKPVSELQHPYPVLYHFPPEANRSSLTEKGLLPVQEKVWLTDRKRPQGIAGFKKIKMHEPVICFRIDTEQLISSGHRINIMNCFHEFTTDCVPPDCLRLTGSSEEQQGR